MGVESLKAARRRTVGTRQTLRAVENDQAACVFLARDAEERVIRDLLQMCGTKGIEVQWVETMELLGKACGIQVGAASAAILK
ncbi:MAG: ribosomal L7Ae/L30e/S12e/Gadd45 family protein [Syntrophomonadaceae bacterium]|nr:ribosomal L7Ae/L30e/S12e/Gadd45 family protein [Syntrophomonadaceae bacterium]